MKKNLLIFLAMTVLGYSACDFSRFASYQNTLVRPAIEERLAFFLQKDAEVGSYFSLSDEAFTLFDGPEIQENRKIVFTLHLAKEKRDAVSANTRKRTVKGLKVAIDPGHLGGTYAYLEDRYIAIQTAIGEEAPICFDEGTLAMLTAWHLKTLLEQEGALVLLTRDQVGKGALEDDFFIWLQKNPQHWSSSLTLKQIFAKFYNKLDLRARAAKINAFAPDLTLVIHYNGHEEKGKSSNYDTSIHNYNLVFGPGAFCRQELSQEEYRFAFLRLLLTEDIPESILLGKSVVHQLAKHLDVPAINKQDQVYYLDKISMKVSEGVYLRNLALTRLIDGPVCYGESLVQNHVGECRNLSRKDCTIEGHLCSSRIKQVAQGYFEGIKEYINLD